MRFFMVLFAFILAQTIFAQSLLATEQEESYATYGHEYLLQEQPEEWLVSEEPSYNLDEIPHYTTDEIMAMMSTSIQPLNSQIIITEFGRTFLVLWQSDWYGAIDNLPWIDAILFMDIGFLPVPNLTLHDGITIPSGHHITIVGNGGSITLPQQLPSEALFTLEHYASLTITDLTIIGPSFWNANTAFYLQDGSMAEISNVRVDGVETGVVLGSQWSWGHPQAEFVMTNNSLISNVSNVVRNNGVFVMYDSRLIGNHWVDLGGHHSLFFLNHGSIIDGHVVVNQGPSGVFFNGGELTHRTLHINAHDQISINNPWIVQRQHPRLQDFMNFPQHFIDVDFVIEGWGTVYIQGYINGHVDVHGGNVIFEGNHLLGASVHHVSIFYNHGNVSMANIYGGIFHNYGSTINAFLNGGFFRNQGFVGHMVNIHDGVFYNYGHIAGPIEIWHGSLYHNGGEINNWSWWSGQPASITIHHGGEAFISAPINYNHSGQPVVLINGGRLHLLDGGSINAWDGTAIAMSTSMLGELIMQGGTFFGRLIFV